LAAALAEAIYYLKRAEEDYRELEMHASVQDALYLQTIIYERLGEPLERDAASRQLKEAGLVEKRMTSEMDTGMMQIWEVVCQIGVAVANGDTI
jgi:anaphase-promoting complex subunit 5